MVTKEDIVNDLLGRSTVKRRKAAKDAQKIKGQFCAELVQALQLEIDSKDSWQTKVEIVKSLGLLGCSIAETPLRDIVFSYSTTEGALEAIGHDKMKFDDETCRSLIERLWDFGSDRPKGYTDPRYGLAAACAGWDKDVCHNFLRHCLEANDAPLCYYVSKNSLQGKFVKLR